MLLDHNRWSLLQQTAIAILAPLGILLRHSFTPDLGPDHSQFALHMCMARCNAIDSFRSLHDRKNDAKDRENKSTHSLVVQTDQLKAAEAPGIEESAKSPTAPVAAISGKTKVA